MAGENITQRKATFTLPVEKAAKIMGIKLEYDSYDDFYYEIRPKDILNMNLRMPKKFDGADEYFTGAVAYALEDAERDGMAAAAHKKAVEALENAYESISGVTCEYDGENSDGEQVGVSTEASILSANVDMAKDLVTLEIENPEHLINAMITGVGMFGAEIPVDGEMDQKTFESYAHVLGDYFDVYGARKPEVDLDRIDSGNSDEFFAEMLDQRLSDISIDEIPGLIEDYIDRTDEEDVASVMADMSRILGGRISVEDMKTAWNKHLEGSASSKLAKKVESKVSAGKNLVESKQLSEAKNYMDFKEPFFDERFAEKLNKMAADKVAVPATPPEGQEYDVDSDGFVLTDEFAKELARTHDVFMSGKYAKERIDGAKEGYMSAVQDHVKELSRDLGVQPRGMKIDIRFDDREEHVGMWIDLKVNGESKEFWSGGRNDEGAIIDDAASNWEWAYALMDNESPFRDESFISAYMDDNNSQVVDQFASDYDHSETKQDIEDWFKKVFSNKSESVMKTGKTLYEMARQVTDKVAAAFLAGEKKKVGNTETDGTSFFLHGNEIATKKHGDLYVSNAGWPTATTRERINGIIKAAGIDAGVAQKGGKQMLRIGSDNQEWDGKWKSVGSLGGEKADDKEFVPAANESKQPKFKSRIDEEVEIAKSIDPRLFKMFEGA